MAPSKLSYPGARAPAADVTSPRLDDLAPLLRAAGASVRTIAAQTVRVEGIGSGQVGDLAARAAIPIYQLTDITPSLEDAFMKLTHAAAEFTGGAVAAPATASHPTTEAQ
jgi:ABC-2 type transport system ATP-binding protein